MSSEDVEVEASLSAEDIRRKSARMEELKLKETIVDVDGPTVTRARPGYLNPLRLNPLTPPPDRPESPIDPGFERSAWSDSDQSSVDSSIINLDGINDEISREIDLAMKLEDEEATMLQSREEQKAQARGQRPGSSLKSIRPVIQFNPAVRTSKSSMTPSSSGMSRQDSVGRSSTSGITLVDTPTKRKSAGSPDMGGRGYRAARVPANSRIDPSLKKVIEQRNASAASISDGNKPDRTLRRKKSRSLSLQDRKSSSDSMRTQQSKKSSKFKAFFSKMRTAAPEKDKQPARDPSLCKENKSTPKSRPDSQTPKVFFMSPHDYMMIDINKEDANRGLNAGVESNKNSPTKDSAKGDEAGSKDLERSRSQSPKDTGKKSKVKKGKSGNAKEGKGNESPNRAGFQSISEILPKFSEESPMTTKIQLTRKYTGTEHKLIPLKDTKSPRRPNDPRIWESRNLRCASCVGDCAICAQPCCTSRAAKEILAGSPNVQTEMARHMVSVINSYGANAKDTSTFAVCNASGGCNRRVCPYCCGACPVELCGDIQCKECKDDPWTPCAWHDA